MFRFELRCKDLGFESCGFAATGDSESELKRKFYFHSMIYHQNELNQMELEQKIELENKFKQILVDQD